VEAKQTRSLGTSVLGRLPANVAGPSGFSGLVKVTAYSDVLDAWAGLTATAPSVSRAGTVAYWNSGTATYNTITLTASGATASKSFSSTLTATLGATTVHISASLRTGAVTLTDACSGTCTRTRTVCSAEPPIVGDITYRIDHVDSSTGQTVVDADL